MFRTLGTLAAFTVIGAVLYKYNPEIFAAFKNNNADGAKNPSASNNNQTGYTNNPSLSHQSAAPAPYTKTANAAPAKSNVM